MTKETLLAVENISHSFNGVKAIDELSFKIQRGEVVALLGSNGAGKSTTLNIVTGNLHADQGSVKICGNEAGRYTKQALQTKNNLGYLPDTPPLYRELTVQEYLHFAARIHGVEKTKVKSSVESIIEVCSLGDVQKRLIANLSKGYKQRVGIAQAIVHDPDLVILDEPTIGLDPVQMQDIRALLADLSQTHSVLLSTHILAEAESTCNRVLIIDQGKLLLDQTLQDLNKSSGNRLRLRFNVNPPIEEIKTIPGCESVSCAQYGNFVCRYSDAKFIQRLQEQALEKHWQLYEITPMASTLEQVFLDLVVRDTPITNKQEI